MDHSEEKLRAMVREMVLEVLAEREPRRRTSTRGRPKVSDIDRARTLRLARELGFTVHEREGR